jgi:hypothetical protein
MNEKILRCSRRNDDHSTAELDLTILGLLRDILDSNIEALTAFDELERSCAKSKKSKGNEIIDEFLRYLGYRRFWNRSNEERLLAASWLSAEFHMWRNVKCCKSLSEQLSPNANLGHTGMSVPQNIRDTSSSEHYDGIDSLVSLYGKINHQLRKYRQLKISLIRKRQAIAKAFHSIPGIKGRGSSTLVFALEMESLSFELDSIMQKMNEEGKVTDSTVSFDRNNSGNKVLKPKRSSSASAASLLDRKQIVSFKDPDGITDESLRKAVPPIEPTITKALSDRILEELEVKLYNMKKMEVDLLRNRESEAAVVMSLLSSDSFMNYENGIEREALGEEDIEKQKSGDSYHQNDNDGHAVNAPEGRNHRDSQSPSHSSSSTPFLNRQTGLFQGPLKGYGEMAGELEDAVGSILKGKHLSESEMMAIIEAVDVEWEETYGQESDQINSSQSHSLSKHRREEAQLRRDLSDPLFRSYQTLLSHSISSQIQDLSSLREQHGHILRRTAALCEPFSPFDFVFYD